MRKMELVFEKKITKIEKTLGVTTNPDGYFVLLRTKKRWILDSVGNPVAVIVKGQPTDLTVAGVFADKVWGPFDDESEAQICLEAELEKIRLADPKRFLDVGSLQKMILPEPTEGGDVNEKQK